MEVEVKIQGLFLDPLTNSIVLVLWDEQDQRVLQMSIGLFEADAIVRALENIEAPRPLTHDLLKNLPEALGAKMLKVVVSDVIDDAFHSTIWLEKDGQSIGVDSRPSDAIALALRAKCPIFIDEAVFEKIRELMMGQPNVSDEGIKKMLDDMDPDKMGHA